MAILARRALSLFWRAAGLGLTLLFLVGFVVRLSVKDHFAIICAIYYALTPLVLALLAIASGAYWLIRKKKRTATVILAAGALCFLWFYQSSYVTNSQPDGPSLFAQNAAYGKSLPTVMIPSDEKPISDIIEAEKQNAHESSPIRLLFWNTCRDHLGRDGIVSTIRSYDPDVIALVETGYPTFRNWQKWRNDFPGYSITGGNYCMMMLCRGHIIAPKVHRLTRDSRYKTAEIEVRGERFNLALVDLGSAPLRSRTSRIKKLTQMAKSRDDEPLIIVGDFNLPHDSVHFCMFDDYLQNAFRTAGDGYAPTWPMPMPLIQIDHAWTNRHVEVDRCQTGWSRHSDHRPLILDFHCK